MTETVAGATNREYVGEARNHLWFQNQQYADLTNADGPLVIEKGEGIYLWDVEGNRYIDGLSGLWVVAAGHSGNVGCALVDAMPRLGDPAHSLEHTVPAVLVAESHGQRLADPGVVDLIRVDEPFLGENLGDLFFELRRWHHGLRVQRLVGVADPGEHVCDWVGMHYQLLFLTPGSSPL